MIMGIAAWSAMALMRTPKPVDAAAGDAIEAFLFHGLSLVGRMVWNALSGNPWGAVSGRRAAGVERIATKRRFQGTNRGRQR